jgi:CRP-like cAMP-binding protein
MDGSLWYLKKCSLFESLTPQEAERLNRRASVRTFRRRDLVYGPAETAGSVMVVAEGRVKIKDITPDGKETILAFLEEGELFGELALVDGELGGPRREYAEAVVDSRVLLVPRDEMLRLLDARPDMAFCLTRLIGLRRRRIESRLRNLLFLPSRDRLIHILLELQESHGGQAGGRCEIRLPLSHQDLAGLIGVTRETVTVLLGRLRADRLVKVQRRRITILDCERLAAALGRRPPCAAGSALRKQESEPPQL